MVSGRVCHEVDWIGILAQNGLLGSRQALVFIPLCPNGWPQERPCSGFSAELEVSEDVRSWEGEEGSLAARLPRADL